MNSNFKNWRKYGNKKMMVPYMAVGLLKIYKIKCHLFRLAISIAKKLFALHKKNEEHFLNISKFSKKMKNLQ